MVLLRVVVVLLCTSFLANVLAVVPSTRAVATFQPDIPRVYLTNINGTSVSALPMLSTVESEDPLEIALGFVSQLVGTNVQHVVKSAYTSQHNKVHHAYLRQTVNGLEVFNADLNINTWKKQVMSVGHSFYFGTHAPIGTKSAIEATIAFAKHLGLPVQANHLTIAPTDKTSKQIISGFPNVPEVIATLGYIILDGGNAIESVWDLEIDLQNNWFNVHVSAVDLRVVSVYDWVADIESWEIYPVGTNDPHDGSREMRVLPATKTASPLGWNNQGDGKTFTNTQGNNVYAQENLSGGTAWINNGRPDGGADLVFHFPIDFDLQPKDSLNAATTNLFYWNNIIHDIFYEYGFDEAAGNFQENNFGKGGLGVDAVQANCQDGSGTNNANFATPRDGSRPRMRMYIWTLTTPYRDGDFDNGIIMHEYAHGISNRLTGGPDNVNCLGSGEAGGMGEGWGDFFATALRQRKGYTRNMVFPMGDYPYNNVNGIRKYPYTTEMSTNPETYAYINNAGYEGVHAKGEVWCGILWEVYWNLVDKVGFSDDWYLGEGGNNIAFQIVIDGMKLQPCTPNFVQARDAILQAEKTSGGGHACELWKGFAKRGLGVGAIGTGSGVTKVTESFELPSECKA